MGLLASPAATALPPLQSSSKSQPLSLHARHVITNNSLLLVLSPRATTRVFPAAGLGDCTLRASPPNSRAPRGKRFLLLRRAGGGGEFVHDAGATAVVMSGAYVLVLAFDSLTARGLIEQSLSRKLVHILSGLLFMAFWPIFSNSTGARYFASLVPLANCLRLVTYGLSLATDEGLIKSVTREGKPEELLRGPLYYVLVLILCVLVFWRESPNGVIALGMMCGGDGIADIIGRRFGSEKIPYNKKKSWAGSISMFIFGFLVSMGMVYYFSALGYFQLDWAQTMERVALVSLVATIVESLSTADTVDDNISVPLASMVTSYFLFQ